jgi:lipopolysaccharide transport system permease protein
VDAFVAREGANPVTVIDSSGESTATKLAEYWQYRTLFVFLTTRDIRLRYRQTWRGVCWALIQPLLPMLIFAALFARVLRPEQHAGPYWLYVLAGLAPWNFFSNAVNYSSATFIGNFNLLNKVYFPRAVLPVAAVTACLLDLLVSASVLVALSWWQGYSPSWRLFLMPLVMLAEYAVAVAMGLAAASLIVLYRDLKALIPFLVQVWMYSTPVFYPLNMIPERWRWIAWMNPLTAVLETFRYCLFGSAVDWRMAGISALAICVAAIAAALIYSKVQADLAERV